MRSSIAFTFFVLAAWACAFGGDDRKPDYTLTAEAFAADYAKDNKAFKEKYGGKVVEMTGTVWMTRVPRGDVLLYGTKDKKASLTMVVSCTPPEKDLDKLRGLARGLQVTFRGKSEGVFASLGDCEFVKLGPSTAVPTTIAALEREFRASRDAARKKYDGKSVVVKVKVLDAKTEDKRVTWTVTDAAGKGTARLKAHADPILDDKFLKELEMVKAGDVVILIAEADALGDPVRLWDSVVLKEAPPGVKLPGAKK